jgi:hypothetical protein
MPALKITVSLDSVFYENQGIVIFPALRGFKALVFINNTEFKDTVISRAEVGNTGVILDRSDYLRKCGGTLRRK